MATEAPPSELVPPAEPALDEANINASLARLQEMHVALRNLRETIPRVMNSVLVDPPAPEQLHLHFAQAARNAASDIKSFAHIMEDPHSKEALEMARDSEARNAEDITNWLVTEHKDWLDVREDQLSGGIDSRADAGAEVSGEAIKVEAMQTLLEKFRESHPGVEASMDESSRAIKLYLPSPAHIHFEIRPTPSDESRGGYKIESIEKTKLHKAILETVAVRTRPDDLELLLEMLVSYADVKSRPCVKCSRLLDPNAQFPIRRSKRRVKQSDGRNTDFWEASHTSCD